MGLTTFYFLAVAGIHTMMAWALYLPYRVQQLHFMTIANMTISGYFAAYATLTWGWPFLAVVVAGILIGALVGFLTSFGIGDAPAFAVVIVGFTYIYISKTIVENVDALGGTLGLFGIPMVAGSPQANRWLLFAVTWFAVLVIGALIHRFDNSRLGRAASAIFTDKTLAAALGVNIKKMGMGIQTAASAIGGLCGVLYAFIYRGLFPDFFTFHYIGIAMSMLFIGGYTTQWGVLFAVPILWGLPFLLPEALQSYRIVMYGVLLIAILLVKPEGLITRPLIRRVIGIFGGRPPGGRATAALEERS